MRRNDAPRNRNMRQPVAESLDLLRATLNEWRSVARTQTSDDLTSQCLRGARLTAAMTPIDETL
jgi:hypothetical protein